MKIVFLTPGTGSYYCGACMRDNMLARELLRTGHDVTIAPMYLPLMIDADRLPGLEQTPIFFGGINIYLQQKLAIFRKTPAIFDRLLNSRGLLHWAARHSHMTSAREHGEMALQMLEIEASPFRKELDKLFEWLGAIAKPEIICLSNALLAGFIPELKRRLGVPVVAFFQGEDTFLDGLPEPYRTRCWTSMGRHLAGADALLAPSRFYASFIGERLGLAPGAIAVVSNGIALEGYGGVGPSGMGVSPMGIEEHGQDARATQSIGYLARLSREKGLDLFVEAFIALARDLGDTTTRLKIAGAATAGDERFIAQQKRRLAEAGLTARVEWTPNLSREQKTDFLRSLTLFSVPTIYAEAFGLYVIEAMASGVPVVQPDSAAFPELLSAGGGICVPPRDPSALARAWQQLLGDPARRQQLAREGRASAEKNFSSRAMSEQFLQAIDRFLRAPTR